MGRFMSNGVDDAVSCGTGSAGGLSIFVAEEQLSRGGFVGIIGAYERLGGCCRNR